MLATSSKSEAFDTALTTSAPIRPLEPRTATLIVMKLDYKVLKLILVIKATYYTK